MLDTNASDDAPDSVNQLNGQDPELQSKSVTDATNSKTTTELPTTENTIELKLQTESVSNSTSKTMAVSSNNPNKRRLNKMKAQTAP